jgi:hypothetical protein
VSAVTEEILNEHCIYAYLLRFAFTIRLPVDDPFCDAIPTVNISPPVVAAPKLNNEVTGETVGAPLPPKEGNDAGKVPNNACGGVDCPKIGVLDDCPKDGAVDCPKVDVDCWPNENPILGDGPAADVFEEGKENAVAPSGVLPKLNDDGCDVLPVVAILLFNDGSPPSSSMPVSSVDDCGGSGTFVLNNGLGDEAALLPKTKPPELNVAGFAGGAGEDEEVVDEKLNENCPEDELPVVVHDG